MGWTLGLLGEEPSDALLALLKDLPVACHGGWHPAREASFGPGWPGSTGEDLCVLCEELHGDVAERLCAMALLDPGDPRWGVDVDGRSGLLARIGVAEGLRLRPVDDMRFWMARHDYELPQTAPAGVDIFCTRTFPTIVASIRISVSPMLCIQNPSITAKRRASRRLLAPAGPEPIDD